MRAIGAGFVLLSLAACATPCPDAAPQRRDVAYACDDGSNLKVTFDRAAGRAFVSEDGGAALDLGAQISGSGFRYRGDGGEIRVVEAMPLNASGKILKRTLREQLASPAAV